MSKTISAGIVTAYGAAVRGGYTGTYAQFCEALGQLAQVLEDFEGFSVEVTTLEAGSPATADYHDGVLYLGIPQGQKGDTGEKGDTGNGIASITKTGTSGLVDTYTVTYTDGTTTTFTVTNGAKGDKGDTGAIGNGIQSITKTGTSGNVDTYTITYTNGQTTTFTVTNGAVSSVAGKTGAVTLDANDVAFSESGTYDDGTVGKELSAQKNAIGQLESEVVTDVTVTGTDVTIVAEANKRYLCGTVSTIAVTPCATGAFDLIFTSGTSAAILTIPNTVKWQDSSFDPTALDISTIYEISVADGVLGLVAKWT